MYRLMCYAVFFSGLPWLIRMFVSRNRATIILYHDPSKEIFERHISYIRTKYTIVPLARLVDQIAGGTPPPAHALVVTFDDGHRGNYDLLPVFEREQLHPTIYACSSIIGTTRKFWFKLPGLKTDRIKQLSNRERVQYLDSQLGFDIARTYSESERESLSETEIQALAPVVDIQSHTCFHPILTTCLPDEAASEIAGSREVLEKITGKQVVHFAYPNGDYSDREVEILRQNNFLSGRTTDIGWNGVNADLYRLKAINISDGADMIMLKAELSGIPGYLYNIYKSGVTWQSLKGFHVAEKNKR